MQRHVYDHIVSQIAGGGSANHHEILEQMANSDIARYDTLLAIATQQYQARMRGALHNHKRPGVLDRYVHELNSQRHDLVSLAEQEDIAPCLLARLVLKHQYGWSTKSITQALRAPHKLADQRLALQLQRCVDADEHYSPLVDVVRRVAGVEAEYVLYETLRGAGIAFDAEQQLRAQGHAKTPDVRLLTPWAVRWGATVVVVHWCDSKAQFGDDYVLQRDRAQLLSYVHRYGPGLVLYWRGFLLEHQHAFARDGIYILDRVPPGRV